MTLTDQRSPVFELPCALGWLAKSREGREWLRRLPYDVEACVERWELTLDPPYEQSYVSLVFPATTGDGSPAVLKMQFPHPECRHEAEALRRWDGRGVVQLFDADAGRNAMLIERCEPGEHLSAIRPAAALDVLAELLPRLWIPAGEPFRRLRDEADGWAEQLPKEWARAGRPFETKLMDAALDALADLRNTRGPQVLLDQDLHGDNVLRAAREPWLAIDPKPLVGEREFGLAPIVRSRELGRGRRSVIGRLDRLTGELGLDRERARLWSFAQTLAWSIEDGKVLPDHVETARWLLEA